MKLLFLAFIAILQVNANAFTTSPKIGLPSIPVELKGRVVNENGEPIARASIQIKGTDKGTQSNDDGNFTLTYNNSDKTTLLVSAVGYANVEIALTSQANQRTLTVTLRKTASELNEVIVAAYGTTKKSAYSGAATVVLGEKIQKIQSSNVSQALQGMSPGVQVLNTNGQPGSNGTILIRGLSSMQNNTDPLIILDGMPYSGGLSAINPMDIQSFTILKDAAATSLYGSRAANGVVVITTKKGGAVPQINLRSNFGYSDFAVRFPDKVSAVQLFELGWEALRNGKLDEGLSPAAAAQFATDNVTLRFFQQARQSAFDDPKPIGLDGKIKPGVKQRFSGDWFGEMFRQSLRQEYSLDFSGSAGQEQKTQYYLSASYLKDNGNMLVQKFNRISARANITSDVKKWLKVGTSLAYTSSFSQNPFVGTRFIRVMPEVYPVYVWDYAAGQYQRDNNGKLIPDFGDTTRTEWRGWNTRFIGDFQNGENWDFSGNQYDLFTTRSFVEVKILPALVFRSSISTDLGTSAFQTYSSSTIGGARGNGGSAYRSFSRQFSYTINNLLTYDKIFGEHHLNILAGQEAYKLRYISANATKRGFPIPGIYEMGAASTLVSSGSDEDNYRLSSYLSKVEYSFMNRYFLTGSFRTDGSSRFHPEKRWGKLWSAGASWRFSDEDFLKTVSWLSNARLRATYGTTGNDNVGYYAYQGLYATGYNFLDLAGVLRSRLPTPNLKWESNSQVDFGIDVTLFNNVNITIDWFNRKSKDLIFYKPLPPSTGNGGIDENIGDVKNYGWEFSVNANIINTKSFRWNVDANASSYKNKIVRLPQKEIYNGRYKWTEGVSRYEFYGPLWAGVNPETGNNSWWKTEADGKLVRTEVYADVNKVDQMRYLGSSIPDWFGSITNTFNYKGIDLSVMLYFSLGGKMYDSDYTEGVRWRRGFNLSKQILDRWTPENKNTNIPRISEFTQSNVSVYSSQYLFNNTFARLRNLNIGYTVPAAVTKRLHISAFRMYVQGTNLFTWGAAARRGTDPETAINGAVGDGANGSGAAPTFKSYSVGLQVTL
ncbi:MAG TPA: TonB-dependent receptor [Chitinophaga sp.]|uniref:SusC/RagA family TonB-linked outer membrane protein n=1 Tax=Chitinophaga sp. TaxID=1869181 RepID=UPI002B5C48E4|nr:TonB-dependent receptor [Chitinophaga sp.]HVI45882.1 TonB-dependent receptor [Chitinophaga sp.]